MGFQIHFIFLVLFTFAAYSFAELKKIIAESA